MSFNSVKFLIFFAIVLVGHWLIPSKARWVWLLIASYYFYLSWNVWCGFLIVGTTLVSYFSALILGKTDNKAIRKLVLIITLLVCLGAVFVFKYLDFVLGNIIAFLNLFSLNLDSVAFNLILPVGISFYTFQTLSYVIDVYRGTVQPEKHLGYFALFVTYFPQLVAGPIERPDNLIPELRKDRKFNWQDMEIGLRLALIGFFRKCVVADFLGSFTNTVLANIDSATSLSVFIAGAFFMFQIYCDFAGYSEIARGVSKMMGINLMQNFDSPFLATSITEFMRRWHISLMAWFKDYVYIPLGGNRKGKARKYFNILVVYALSGLWHGANWTYVLWGLYVCLFTIFEGLVHKPFIKFTDKIHFDRENEGYKWIRRIILLLIVIPAGLMFRASSVTDIAAIYSKLFSGITFSREFFNATLSSLNNMNLVDIIEIILIFVALYQIAMIYEHKAIFNVTPHPLPDTPDPKALTIYRETYSSKAILYVVSIGVIALAWLVLVATNTSSQFVYFQF